MPKDDKNPQRKLTPAVWIATGLGVGLVAPAPGTVGALWGIAWAWWLLSEYAPAWAWFTVPLGIVLGIPLCTRAAKDLGGGKDPGAIVWDEIATVPLVFLPTLFMQASTSWPHASWPHASWIGLGLGFLLHRLFDISKPPPCRQLEKLPDGLGVMLDDVAAAAYAAVLFALILFFF